MNGTRKCNYQINTVQMIKSMGRERVDGFDIIPEPFRSHATKTHDLEIWRQA